MAKEIWPNVADATLRAAFLAIGELAVYVQGTGMLGGPASFAQKFMPGGKEHMGDFLRIA
jgi:hypothetical protein